MSHAAKAGRLRTPWRPVVVYAVVAVLWITFSDMLTALVVGGVGHFTLVEILKGWVFVAATSGLLYALIRRDTLALRRSEARHRASLECMADALYLIDSQGRIVEANRAMRTLFKLEGGRVPEDVQHLVELFDIRRPDGSRVPRDETPSRRALRGETVLEEEFQFRRQDGELHYIHVTASPVVSEADPSPMLAVVMVRDVTELKRLERMRDEFLSIAAHELRTPITTIKGYAQLLDRWTPGGHEPREGKAFQILSRQSDRLSELVQELLEVSRLQLGRLELRRQRFELGELVSEVLDRMEGVSSRHRLVLHREGPVFVDADRDRIEQVLTNLVDNAIKYSPGGGDIEVWVRSRGSLAEVSIRDQGMGIPRERQGQVFERFYRAHAGLGSDRGGMGIGLHLSEQILQRHGGRIWFESEEGKGSTFSFSLALAEQTADAHP
ncbi:cell wall metabolism sensor histidine kinase WalK [Vitiosangium sp. GDMCC 1.1324]|uniref:sensor histidine kinase n=1 Tax=Vitiosangium sp. (strain GDMCC 1.1324) TaxID=2138576 RepID=UPI000D3DA247|nr:ATP-binding protein [Vitiosangium sp. GDMCC 1.1324]PTL82705.1 PAS domain-containing sensor histidine kinase [Vitiosangium sp. GDMCC 1.1324]